MKISTIICVATMACLAPGGALAQTTRTSPSASSTTQSIPSSSSTSPNSPCNPNNPTSPCYSANAPRAPCYSATSPGEPCSTTTTPSSQAAPTTPPAAVPGPLSSAGGAFTADQAKARIEAAGYSSVSGLRREPKGGWRGTAAKDGLRVDVLLDAAGKISAK
jgi:hypothetical protein